MSVWADQHVEKRQGELHRKPPDPEDVHEFQPSRRPDDDNCALCRRAFESAFHFQIADEALTDTD